MHRSLILAGVMLAGCGNDGGSSSSGIEKDPSISGSVGDTGVFSSVVTRVQAGAGLPKLLVGARPGEVVDGWEVRYDRFLVTIGDFRAVVIDSNGAPVDVGDGRVEVVDLLGVDADGLVLHTLEHVAVGMGSEVGFSIVNASEAAEVSRTVDDEGRELMLTNRYSLYIEGSIFQEGGQTCTPGNPDECKPVDSIRFAWGIQAPTEHTGCDPFDVEDGRPTEVTMTLAGDRWFAVDFAGARSERRAQWIADADRNGDGETTLEELDQIAATDLFPDDLYDLSRPIVPVETALDFLVAQAHMVGDDATGNCSASKPL